jgi:hypothetical protein
MVAVEGSILILPMVIGQQSRGRPWLLRTKYVWRINGLCLLDTRILYHVINIFQMNIGGWYGKEGIGFIDVL